MKKFSKLLIFLLLAGALSGCAKETEEKEIVLREYKEKDYEGVDFTMESDDLLFALDPATTQFTVTQKSTGKVWRSNPENVSDDPIADLESKRLLQSVLVMKYSTVNETTTELNTFAHSIENGLYTLEKVDNDTIKVNYSIGKVSKKFIIPPAVPEARMMEFYEKLDRSEQRRVDNAYRKIDINSLLATDNKDELLKLYPDLETTCVFEVRSATKDHQKEKLQEAFAAVGYTEEEYEKDCLIYQVGGDANKKVYNVSVLYHLEGDKLVVEVPMDEIEYNSEYPITELSVLPYFGAGIASEEGFLLVPEGSGAIINFNNGKTNLSAYYAQVYGWDYGMKRKDFINETRAAFPVFGISHSDGAMLATLDDYATLAAIQADVSGRRHSYNYAYATYTMVHGSKMDISAKTDSTVIAYEKSMPAGSIKQSYHFMEETSYSDMAKAYRKELQNRYPELQKVTEAQLPLSVEFIAAVDRVKQIMGIPVNRPEVMTGFEDAETILKDIASNGYANLSLRYTGWMNGGVAHSLPKDIDITSGMGGKKGLESFLETAKGLGVDVYLTGRTQNAYDSNLFDGFFKMRDVAKYISREVVEIPEFSHIWFGGLEDSRMEPHYLLRPSVSITLMDSLASYVGEYGVGVGFEDTGYLLSGDYNPKRAVSREDALDLQTAALAEVKATGTPITMTAGNDYALPYASLITDVDLVGKEYLILDKMVPFYEIAIHGLVDYTGSAVNLSGDAVSTVLDCAETGAGLAFSFYAEDTDLLQGTEYMDFFGANYDDWKEMANGYAVRYEKEMAGLNNKYITEHRILADGVTATVYEDSTVVYVNKSTDVYTDDTITIPARDYVVERSGN